MTICISSEGNVTLDAPLKAADAGHPFYGNQYISETEFNTYLSKSKYASDFGSRWNKKRGDRPLFLDARLSGEQQQILEKIRAKERGEILSEEQTRAIGLKSVPFTERQSEQVMDTLPHETQTAFKSDDWRDHALFRGESEPPKINRVENLGGDASRISNSDYPTIRVEMSNGSYFTEKIRVSDHPQVSSNAPRYYDTDIRISPSDTRSQINSSIEKQMQVRADEIWNAQRKIAASLVHSRNAIEDYALSASLSSEVDSVVSSLEQDGKLPSNLPAALRDKMSASLKRYFGKISSTKIQQFTDKAASIIQDTLRTTEEDRGAGVRPVEVGLNPATGRTALTGFLEDAAGGAIGDFMNVGFFLRIAREVVQGGTQYVAQNWDQTRIDEFPALELHRVYDREVPRGSEKDPAGPTNGWDDDDGRWPAACDDAGDDDAMEVFESTGRMVALKDSDVWDSLGDGAGGYDDTLGNPFAPFAFNSGMDTDEVSRSEAESLGLLDEGEEAKPAKVDFSTLFDLPEDLDARCAKWLGKNAALEAGGETSTKGCLMAMFPQKIAARILEWSAANVPDEDLYPAEGRENEIHCTARYGFLPDFDASKLAPFLAKQPQVTMKLGKITRFDNPLFDVLKIDIESPSMESLHAKLNSTFADDLTPSTRQYHAHCTIAYLKKGALPELDGRTDFVGDKVTGSEMLYSLPRREGRQTFQLNQTT